MPLMSLPIRRALISVSDKTGAVDFGRELAAAGVQILSTGGTAALLTTAGLDVLEVARYTGDPEMLDGRVKTLHPKVHGGILARRDRPDHLEALAQAGGQPIDLVAVNLYPFEATVARADCVFEDAIENIDIGGPAMIRAAAKNHDGVVILTDPLDYPLIVDEMTRTGGVSAQTRFRLACKAFAHTAAYDGAIANYLSSLAADGSRRAYPDTLTLQFAKVQDLRYGENPHQSAALYRENRAPAGLLVDAHQLQGKELSYNNLADADAAWSCACVLPVPSCVIVKHANPCGVAMAATTLEAYSRAFATDPDSAFGGIIAFNAPVDGATASAVACRFVEVVIAPAFDEAARTIFAKKANVRLLTLPADATATQRDMKRIGGGLLVQEADAHRLGAEDLSVVTQIAPTSSQVEDLLFAWRVAQFVKSNAIVFAAEGRTLGIGAGQMSRVDSARMATIKARAAGLALEGSVVASDAFFPFPDGLEVVLESGASAVIQPGGSVRDESVIATANARGTSMVFTGVRHFRH